MRKQTNAEWQRARADAIAKIPSPHKRMCLICFLWYRQVGSHIVQRHKMTARQYRVHFNLEVKKGILPPDLKELYGKQALENGTYKNLKKGKKFRFKKGQSGVGIYKRSPITQQRLSGLYKLTKKYNERTNHNPNNFGKKRPQKIEGRIS